MKNVVVLLYHYFARIPRNLSPLRTDLACKVSVLYLCDRKIRKNRTHFQFGKSGSDYTDLVR